MNKNKRSASGFIICFVLFFILLVGVLCYVVKEDSNISLSIIKLGSNLVVSGDSWGFVEFLRSMITFYCILLPFAFLILVCSAVSCGREYEGLLNELKMVKLEEEVKKIKKNVSIKSLVLFAVLTLIICFIGVDIEQNYFTKNVGEITVFMGLIPWFLGFFTGISLWYSLAVLPVQLIKKELKKVEVGKEEIKDEDKEEVNDKEKEDVNEEDGNEEAEDNKEKEEVKEKDKEIDEPQDSESK